jgi:integrase
MRRGELLSLTWDNIDFRRRTAYLPETKNGEARTVPLSSRAIAVLTALPRSMDGRVFPITANALKIAFERAVRRAGIEDLHFHDLRHEATSRLAEKLPNVIELAAVTGHKDLRMLKRYYHPRAEDLARKLG